MRFFLTLTAVAESVVKIARLEVDPLMRTARRRAPAIRMVPARAPRAAVLGDLLQRCGPAATRARAAGAACRREGLVFTSCGTDQLGFEHGVSQPRPPGSVWAARACFASDGQSRRCRSRDKDGRTLAVARAAVGPGASQGAPELGAQTWAGSQRRLAPPVSYWPSRSDGDDGNTGARARLECSLRPPCLRRLDKPDPQGGAPITTKNKHCFFLQVFGVRRRLWLSVGPIPFIPWIRHTFQRW